MMARRFKEKPDGSNRGAALLLLKVRMIAIDEIRESPSPLPSPTTTLDPYHSDFSSSESANSSVQDEEQRKNVISPQIRCRTVSVGSQDMISEGSKSTISYSTSLLLPQANNTAVVEPEEPDAGSCGEEEEDEEEASEDRNRTSTSVVSPRIPIQPSPTPLPFSPSSAFVGTSVEGGTIKAVLRKKFSWKSYPELEGYLIAHRDRYMEYSSQLNYTAEQKRYNNTLTQGLLDLAAAEGYCFEGFTFAMIRDRIRCYYKSYVQATKKKKRRKNK